jgi:hypothetical protein
MPVLYEIMRYTSVKEFNEDAARRYGEVMAERTPNSYDRFWKAESATWDGPLSLTVLWSKPAPLRKG